MNKEEAKQIREAMIKGYKKDLIKKIPIRAWDMWNRNFFNAKRFFGTKGNINTKSRLKDKWSREFQEDIKKLL